MDEQLSTLKKESLCQICLLIILYLNLIYINIYIYIPKERIATLNALTSHSGEFNREDIRKLQEQNVLQSHTLLEIIQMISIKRHLSGSIDKNLPTDLQERCSE
jgi:hypothetical protein